MTPWSMLRISYIVNYRQGDARLHLTLMTKGLLVISTTCWHGSTTPQHVTTMSKLSSKTVVMMTDTKSEVAVFTA